ncbi:MAG: PrgI family protein [Patescibacteria group bacterium]
MRFSVPQFIEIEDKIFGPLTFKQFIYVAGGAGISFLIFNFVSSFFLAILLILPLAGLSLSLAFYRVNDKPFIDTVEAAFNYALKDKLYIWKKETKKAAGVKDEVDTTTSYVPRLSDSRLKDLSWSLDVIDTTKRG